jgi:hypothetical protein
MRATPSIKAKALKKSPGTSGGSKRSDEWAAERMAGQHFAARKVDEGQPPPLRCVFRRYAALAHLYWSLAKESPMRHLRFGLVLACVACLPAVARAVEPAAEKDLPFWLVPHADLDLRSLTPVQVALVTGPDTRRAFSLLQTGPDIPAAIYVPSNPLSVPFFNPNDSGYQVVSKGLNDGASPYGDRKYKITKLPTALAGLTLLQTKMGHKTILDGRYSIVVSTPKPCLVFVAVDERAIDTYKQHGAPAWLQEYSPVGHKIATDDPIMAQTSSEYLVFARKSPGGRIVLGPPSLDGDWNAMYFAFFAALKGDGE